jgi:carnitine O-acetyltransferase
LQQTLSKYLLSVEPLLNVAELNNTREVVQAFAKSEGPALHSRLLALKEQKDATGRASWLSDIWFEHAYLKWRMPSYINVNWAMMCRDHPAASPAHEVDPVARAAFLITRLVAIRRQIVTGEWPVEYKKQGQPLCMDQFQRWEESRLMTGVISD